MTKSRRAVFALILSLVLSALSLVLMLFVLQPAAKGGSSAPTPSGANSDQQMTILADDSVPQRKHLPPSEPGSDQQITVTILVDDFAQQFNPGHPCEYHNRLGGERRPIGRSEDVYWGNGVVTAVITADTGGDPPTAGVWTSLNHHVYECAPVNFSAIFPSQIKSQYQGSIAGFRIHILDGQGTFQVQLKVGHDGNCPPETAVYTKTETLTDGEQYISSSLRPDLGEVQSFNWQVIGDAGDFVVVDRVELTATVPYTDTPERAFLWSYAMLLNNWDPKSGLTRDHACYEANEFDNISASGLQAAAAVMAWHRGFISQTSATEIVSKTAQALLDLPRCHGLWPHFTEKVISDTEIITTAEIVSGTEWSSIDTTIAAVALLEAHQALDLPTAEIEQQLRDIDWLALITPDGYIRHGYVTDCSRPIGEIEDAIWTDFGTESWLVNLGCAAATSSTAVFSHTPPTCNGGGFVDELAWLLMPPCCPDRWWTDWCAYSQQAVNCQLAYYRCQEAQEMGCCRDDCRCKEENAAAGCSCCRDHPCYGPLGLFGLTPNEVPDLSAIPPTATRSYLDFGVCGKASCIDGTDPVTIPGITSTVVVSLGHAVIVPHYAGIIASLRPTRAISLWNWLEAEGLFTPLNNVESFMFIDEPTCDPEQIVWNPRKGSWEIGLQTLGWGRYLAGDDNPLYQGFWANDLLRRGYMVMCPRIFLPIILKEYQ
jgi:hypothetical protein